MELVVVAVIAVVVVLVLVYFLRRPARGQDTAEPATTDADGFRPRAADFHVSGGEAHVFFDVPLPEGDPDPVLSEILIREAVEVLREKRSKLPLDGVSTVHAHALRNDRYVEVGKLTLDGPGVLPPPPAPGEHPIFGRHHRAPVDLFEELEGPPEVPEVALRPPTVDLRALTDEVRLTSRLEAGLRAQGVDPASASTAELVAGLLRLAGYTVTGEGTMFTATRDGTRHYVEVVEHGPGEHPELSERAVDQFMVRFGQSGSARGFLFTPKYGPFVVYDKERRQPKVRFITRERFQAFVNSIALG